MGTQMDNHFVLPQKVLQSVTQRIFPVAGGKAGPTASLDTTDASGVNR